MTVYNPWPLGDLPKKWQRPEIDEIRKKGYQVEDPRDAVSIFERKMATYAGSKFAVAVSSCTDALFLCAMYRKLEGMSNPAVIIPTHTYCSVPMAFIHAGFKIVLERILWEGMYVISPLGIVDGSLRFNPGMYEKGTLHCISFQIKKRLPIGKGGMVFTDYADAARWLRVASFEGRHLDKPYDNDTFETVGWNMYMSPEDAARGILILDQMPVEGYPDAGGWMNYTDLSKQRIFKCKSEL